MTEITPDYARESSVAGSGLGAASAGCCGPGNETLLPAAQRDVAGCEAGALLEQLAEAGPETLSVWRQVVETMSEGVLLVGADRRVAYVNEPAEQLIGRRLEEIRGRLCTEAINCPQCKCYCRLFGEGGADAVEVAIFNHADATRRVLRKNARVLRDAQGRVVGGVETFSDITREVAQREENERYAAMLFQEKTRADAMLEAMEDGVFAIDAGGRVVFCSQRAAKVVGLSNADAAVGRLLSEVLMVGPGFFGTGQAAELEGRSFALEVGPRSDRRPASLVFRRVRLSDDEMLGVLRLGGESERAAVIAGCPEDRFHGIVSRSPRMRELFRVIEGAAQSGANVLVEGESGVGKELVARAIHELSPRGGEPFYAVNCATFTGSLLVSELFGHERGAFTGAFQTTPGKLELAGAGTLFLDEVSEIPLHYQGVLLRVLEDRHFERVGGRKRVEMRARIVAATNRRLAEEVQQQRFRADLFFRLKVIPICVPPLRERSEDVPLLAQHFASLPAVNRAGAPVRFTEAALEAMRRYPWPGNVRELRNLVEYLCFARPELVDVGDLPPEIRGAGGSPGAGSPQAPARPAPGGVDERAAVLEALQRARFRKAEAAQLLGIDRTTLWRKMKRLGL